MIVPRFAIAMLGSLLIMPAMASSAAADCPCQEGTDAIPISQPLAPIPEPGWQYPPSHSVPRSMMNGRTMLPHTPTMAAPSQPPSRMPRTALSPPPGNLGRVYRRPSALVPEDVHPRVGMIDVFNLDEDAEFDARGLKATWMGNFWRFESEDPMVPGIPHIYTIRVKRGDDYERRTVRLIRGRILDLEF